MTSIADLLRSSPSARRFFLAYLQSSLGNGMGYVALVLIALERFHSAWAVALILIADLVPLMAIGPLLGGAADRLPRRACAVGADLLRAGAFIGIALVGGLVPTLALAVLAGVGNGIFNPAALAGLPHLAGERQAAATSLYGAISTLGKTVGPVAAAAILLGGGVELALAVNGASFLVSAFLLASVDLGRAESAPAAHGATPASAVSLRAVAGFASIVAASSGAALFAGISNVAEPGFVTHDLRVAGAGFSIVVGVYGIGVAAGSLSGSGGGAVPRLWTRYLTGILALGAGMTFAGLATAYSAALPAFALAGAGNGLLMVHERLLIQGLVPERALGRAFGTIDMVASWAFAASLILGAVAVAAAGSRWALLVAGLGTVAMSMACALSVMRAQAEPVAEDA